MKIKTIKNEDKDYPKRFLEIKNLPEQIYALGKTKILNSCYTVGIVGSRECTEYGRRVAFEFAKELSKNGICIVSGMAIGIDSFAHNGAIQEKAKTIAILGNGLKYIYPEENEWLFHKIIVNGGCIISEYEPNVEVNKANFPKRNRLISALSDMVLVVEAEHRSGSSITVNYAIEMEKKVGAVPSSIYNYAGIGTNRMLQNGAELITKPSQIIKIIKEESKKKVEKNKQDKIMPKEYQKIYELLSEEPIHINEIARHLKTDISKISSTLTLMELEGLIMQDTINTFKKRG